MHTRSIWQNKYRTERAFCCLLLLFACSGFCVTSATLPTATHSPKGPWARQAEERGHLQQVRASLDPRRDVRRETGVTQQPTSSFFCVAILRKGSVSAVFCCVQQTQQQAASSTSNSSSTRVFNFVVDDLLPCFVVTLRFLARLL